VKKVVEKGDKGSEYQEVTREEGGQGKVATKSFFKWGGPGKTSILRGEGCVET